MEVVRNEQKQKSRREEYITSVVSSLFLEMDIAKVLELKQDLK